MTRFVLLLCSILFFLCACGAGPQAPSVADTDTDTVTVTVADVTSQRIINADSEPQNWLSHGRSYTEERFSPLTVVNDSNVDELGLAWFLDLGTNRGLEATPIVVDGVMYVSDQVHHSVLS